MFFQLRFTSFDIEPSHECVYDYVEIRDGISSVSPIIGRYCGGRSNKPPRLIESSGPDIHVTFRSDISATFDGFYAEYASSDLGFPDGRTGDVLGEDVGDVEELVAGEILKGLSVIFNSKLHFFPNSRFFLHIFRENFTVITYLYNNYAIVWGPEDKW